MARFASLEVIEGLNHALGNLVKGLLEKDIVQAVMVPCRQTHGNIVKQAVVADPGEAGEVDPLAPIVPVSSAVLLAKLTRKEAGVRVAAFLRPCEVRAYVELVKLKQASLENTLLIGVDCLGRYSNTDYVEHFAGKADSTSEILRAMANGEGAGAEGLELVSACRVCETPVAENVDLRLEVIGVDLERETVMEAVTEEGDRALDSLGLPATEQPAGRAQAVKEITEARGRAKESQQKEYGAKVSDLDGLMEIISDCVGCYNCRAVCPVCYCRECVFLTDTFSHDSRRYFDWAKKRGRLRMPTDTLFFHLTRMAHVSTLCVGCGQCTTACPNGIPVSDLFSVAAEGAQAAFDYVPGRDPEEAQPLATFREDELQQVTGQVK